MIIVQQEQAIHISIVSHGHGHYLTDLLHDISKLKNTDTLQLTVTFNKPEAFEQPLMPCPTKYIFNASPLGFSTNHNNAFRQAPNPTNRKFFVILNPDVRLSNNLFLDLATALQKNTSIGVFAPRVYDQDQRPQENGRTFPTLSYIIKKATKRVNSAAIDFNQVITQVDWVGGMCMQLRSRDFSQIGGFDERYHLYYEDVDLCLRLQQKNLSAAILSSTNIIHIGQWQSRKSLRFFCWHLSGLIRFLYRHAKHRYLP